MNKLLLFLSIMFSCAEGYSNTLNRNTTAHLIPTANDITISFNGSAFCPGDTVIINYSYSGAALSASNKFRADLSSPSGSYASPTTIATITSTQVSGMLTAVMPATALAGTGYKIRVVATGNSTTSASSHDFTINPAPQVNFNITTATSQCINQNNFRFTNSTTGTGTVTYLWNFGDGDTTSLATPAAKKYNVEGFYQVVLTATNSICTARVAKTVIVKVSPKAEFNLVDTPACTTQNLTFSNTSSTTGGGTLSYGWNFGDGGTSSFASPTYAYTTKNTYSVRLIVTNSGSCRDTLIKNISVFPLPSPGFTFSYLNRCFKTNSVSFSNSSSVSSGTLNYFWRFGDGDSSVLASPIVSSKKSGTQSVTLTAISDAGCRKSTTQTINILISPIASFIINNDTQCFNGHQFVFTNTSSISTGTFTTAWIIGGKPSSAVSPSFTFSAPGELKAYLVVRATTKCSDSVEKTFVLFPSPQPVMTGPDVSSGKKEETYSVQNTGGTYLWSVSGGTIKSGQGTSQVLVRWDENPGTVGQVFIVQTNNFGCASNPVNKIVLLSSSTVAEQTRGYIISVYPNPSVGEVIIDAEGYTGSYDVKIFNRLGQIITDFKNQRGKIRINLDDYSAGLYFVKIEGHGFIKTEKIILKSR